jgi:hypothetical protein
VGEPIIGAALVEGFRKGQGTITNLVLECGAYPPRFRGCCPCSLELLR